MAKSKKKRRMSKKVSLLTLASLAPVTYQTVKGFQDGGLKNGIAVFARSMTGYDPQANKFEWQQMQNGLFPIVGVAVIKKLLNWTGASRMFSRLPIPISL